MSETDTPPSVATLLLRLIDQQDRGFAEIRGSQESLNQAMASVDKDVALVKQAVDGLKDLPKRVSQMELQQAASGNQIADLERRITENTRHIGDLLTDSNKLKGWSGPAGKIAVGVLTGLLVLVLGAVLAVIGIRNAKAGEAASTDVAAKCWAAPAKVPPKFLYL